jgi:alkanesulfonate monooxygenase SsuD/methylene tetrahydromethanopterin reductase-like flavin-dependent oxidoreductase (luciferase family)
MAAEIADGWLPIFFGPKSDPFYRAALEQGFARPNARRSWDDFEIASSVPVIIGDDVEECASFMKPMMALYIGGMGARDVNFHFDVFARMGHEEACHKIQDAYLDGRKPDAIAAVPTELIQDIALVGPKAKVLDELELWKETVLTTMLVSGPPELLGEIAELVG